MPKKKKNGIVKKIYWGVSIVLMLMIIIGIILLLMGVIKFPFSQQIIPGFGNLNIIDLFGQQPSGSCTFTVDDDEVCLWTNVTGTIRANSPICYIGYNYNNEGWRFAGIIDETSLRFYKESRQATATGHYEFAAICGTPLDFCRTNDVEVDVIDCGDGEWEDVGYTCGWVGEQCGGTCPDSHPLCVDVWFEQNVLWIDDGYVECVCLNPDTEEIHPSWKPDGQYHENEDPFQDDDENGDENGDEDEEPVLNCIDSDGENPFTKGITTYLGKMDPYIAMQETKGNVPGHNKWDFEYSLGEKKPEISLSVYRLNDNEPLLQQLHDIQERNYYVGDLYKSNAFLTNYYLAYRVDRGWDIYIMHHEDKYGADLQNLLMRH